jgi:hypothetical protein
VGGGTWCSSCSWDRRTVADDDEHEFFRRTLGLLQTGPFAGINEETAKNIRKVCRWRLSAVGF